MTTTVQNEKVSSSLLETMNGSKTNNKSATQEAQDRFMTLLVTQMKNQDPLNPLDNAQVTSQLAQLSTVTGINKLNDTLTSYISNSQSSQMLQGASMIGRKVLSTGNTVSLTGGEAKFAFDLASNADAVSIKIKNSAGLTVRELPLGKQNGGTIPVSWDGKDDSGNALTEGNYSYEVTATAAGKNIATASYAYNTVSSVSSTSSDGVLLNLSSNKTIGLNAVKAVY